MSVLCLGEAIVDLFCERPVAGFEEADAFVPHCGGAPANAAVDGGALRRATCRSAGGVGDDPWGRLAAAPAAGARASACDWFARMPGLPHAARVRRRERPGAEPDFIVYGDDIEAGLLSLEDRLEEAIAAHDAVLIGSNTLLGERERALTLRARELALAAGQARPVRPQPASAPLAQCEREAVRVVTPRCWPARHC